MDELEFNRFGFIVSHFRDQRSVYEASFMSASLSSTPLNKTDVRNTVYMNTRGNE